MLAAALDRCERQSSACIQPPCWLPNALELSLSVYNLPQARCRMLDALAGYQPVPGATCNEAVFRIYAALKKNQTANPIVAAQVSSAKTEFFFRTEAQPCAAAAESSESASSCFCCGGSAAHHCSAAAVQLLLTVVQLALTDVAEPSPDDSSAPVHSIAECSHQATEECFALMAAISRDEGGRGLGTANSSGTPCVLLVACNLMKQLAASCNRVSDADPQTMQPHSREVLPLQRICKTLLDFCPLAAFGASAAASEAKQAVPQSADEFVTIFASCLVEWSTHTISAMTTCVCSPHNLECCYVHVCSLFVDVVVPCGCHVGAMPSACSYSTKSPDLMCWNRGDAGCSMEVMNALELAVHAALKALEAVIPWRQASLTYKDQRA